MQGNMTGKNNVTVCYCFTHKMFQFCSSAHLSGAISEGKPLQIVTSAEFCTDQMPFLLPAQFSIITLKLRADLKVFTKEDWNLVINLIIKVFSTTSGPDRAGVAPVVSSGVYDKCKCGERCLTLLMTVHGLNLTVGGLWKLHMADDKCVKRLISYGTWCTQ